MLRNSKKRLQNASGWAVPSRRRFGFRIASGLYGFLVWQFLLPSAGAHDSWLVAEKNTLDANGVVHIAFSTGEVFPTSEHATSPDRVAEWFVQRDKERQPIADFSIINNELGVDITITGTSIVALALKPKYIELSAAKFEDCLRDERADAAIRLRKSRGETEKPGRELYTKFAKTFVEVTYPTLESFFVRPVGHKLEIVPLLDPCLMKVGDELKVRVFLDGQPAAALHVASGHDGLPPHTYAKSVPTDANGEATIPLTTPGPWFLRTHAIRRIPVSDPRAGDTDKTGSGGDAADWESFWASITFRVRPGPSPSP